MWRARATSTSLLLLLVVAAVVTACGGDGESSVERCVAPIDLTNPTGAAALQDPPVSHVTLKEAQELVDFEIALPAELPADAGIRQVRLHHVSNCPEAVDYVALVFEGPDYFFAIEQSDRRTVRIGTSPQPFTINGVEGQKYVRSRYSDDRTLAVATWSKGDVNFYASAFLTEELSEETFFGILESLP